ncbi:alpha/beta hydrolase [Ruegeria sp. HKCCD8929]|uniref:COG3904 family protein n=1 Tax=Ruegeria sp. HKCCD8929 TaxID=2683006 RepID=UPI0014884C1E|nr:alpha/beta hydrolase [Ruegeria sp. HKCCD8929]
MRAVLLLIAFMLSGCETAAVVALNAVETTEFTVKGQQLLMSGEINSKTLNQFNEIYARNPHIKTLVELDVPGSLDDDTMIALAYRVRKLGLNTHLRADSKAHSGGVDLFLAGVNRTIEEGAEIGVHSWSDGKKDAKDYPRGAPEHEENRKYIEDMLGSDAFYWFTIYAAPADGIHIMSRDEIRRFGLET